MPEFIHLRVHSSYSLSEGAITPGALVELCQKNKMPAVAVTDSGNLFASLEFSNVAAKGGVQPIIGCTFQIDCQLGNGAAVQQSFQKMVLIAKDDQGYQNLLKLVAVSFLEKDNTCEPHISIDDLEKHQEGLIVLTGGSKGPIGTLILEKQHAHAEQLLQKFHAMVGDRLYIEILRRDIVEDQQTEPVFLKLAKTHNIPIVATNDVYFSEHHMAEAHDALLCIAGGRYLVEDDRPKVSQECYFKTPREMLRLFKDLPEALENTIAIAKRCAVMSENQKPMLPHFPCGEGRDEAEELKKTAQDGLDRCLNQHVYTAGMTPEQKQEVRKTYDERLEYELGVINSMKFPGYFLIVSDFMRWSNRQGIPVGPGRGSGAGSLVAWSLEITDLDPLRFGLLFERFLNPERVSMPDFDIDFCQERREEVIHYVQEKYGHDRVAQIITFGKLQARAVIRDVGRVLQMPYPVIDRISKMIPFNPLDPVTLADAIRMDKSLQQMQKDDPEVNRLFNIALKLEGLNRHASTHAAGVVIADRPLSELIPLYRDPKSTMPVTGYSMKYSESAGLVKFDFLGLKTLTVIAKACEFIRARGDEIDIRQIPLDDRKTYEMLGKGDSIGVFQLESAGMRDTLRKLKPDNIEDIIALISLYRPGPMDNIPSYIARKHGKEEPDYLHEMLEDILKETYGVIIYQEQVMQIAQVMGGYTLGGADLLRRAMGKKIIAEMDAQRKIFVEGAIKNNVDKSQASGIFDLVAKFAGYGFNKSHAAAYAMISYRTAYLRANYPVEFLAASLNLDIHDTDKINNFIQDAKRHDIPVLLPDINESAALFEPQHVDGVWSLRYALGALKNVGVAAMQDVRQERLDNGAYKDVFDFVSRVNPKSLNKRQLENLVRSGAFDLLQDNRRQLYESAELIVRFGAKATEERNSQQESFFDMMSGGEVVRPDLPPVEEWGDQARLQNEFEALGFYLASHPLDEYVDILSVLRAQTSQYVEQELPEGSAQVDMAGVVLSRRIRSSQRGRFASVLLSDATGLFEAFIYDEDLLSDVRDLLESGSMLWLSTTIRKDEGGVRIMIERAEELEAVLDRLAVSLKVSLSDVAALPALRALLGQRNEGRSRVFISVEAKGHRVKIELPGKYPVNLNAFKAMKSLNGIDKIEAFGASSAM